MPAASNRRARLSAAVAASSARSPGSRVRLQGGGVGGGQRLQVAHHAGQPEHLVAQRAELGRGGFGHAVEQRLVARLQDGDRGAQLVGDVGDQVAADLLLPVQGAGHLVEGGGQLAQLAGRADLADPGGAVPGRHGPGHRDQPDDRAGDPPGHGEPGQQREQGGQPGRPGDGAQQRGLQAAVGGGRARNRWTGPARVPTRWPRTTTGSARLRAVRGGEAGRGLDDLPGLVADLHGRAGAGGQVEDRREVGRRPRCCSGPRPPRPRPRWRGPARRAAGWPGWRRPRRRTPRSARRAARPRPAPRARKASASRSPSGIAAAARRRRRARGRVSHRGPGRAGNRRRGRSGRSADCPDPPRSCGAGSSRASRRCARSPRTRTRAPG